jgi:hypothetical protein
METHLANMLRCLFVTFNNNCEEYNQHITFPFYRANVTTNGKQRIHQQRRSADIITVKVIMRTT